MSGTHLPGLALLDTLRPPAGWRVDRALLSTYSADPAVLAAVLLALVGRDDDGGSGTRVALAHALLELRSRVAFVLQRGRLAAPRSSALALGLLDRFVREVPWNEGRYEEADGRSWHAKIAVLRLVPEHGGAPRWRLWLGSRNLTRDLSWDIGLSIEGQPNGAGQLVAGAVGAMRHLADAAGDAAAWAPLLAEAEAVRWDIPRGLRFSRLDLHLPNEPGRGFPTAPPGLSTLFAASPFLDGASAARLGAWGDSRTRRILLSSRTALAGIACQQARPLSGFAELLGLPAAQSDSASTAEESVEEEADGRGLHAKFIWAEHAAGSTLWLGSANLTRRGWTRNAEAVAEVAVERRGDARAATSLVEGMRAFCDLGKPVRPEDLAAAVAEDPDAERLERARREVAARFAARQVQQSDGDVQVVCTVAPHPDDAAILLSVGRLAGPAVLWDRPARSVLLPSAAAAALGDLLVLSVRLDDHVLSWAQAAPFDPPLGARRDTRDAAALAAWLGAHGLLAAVRDLLSGSAEGDGGGRWDGPDVSRPQMRQGRATGAEAPTVEQVLRAWLRDPARLALADRMIRMPVPPQATDDPVELEARRHLQAFRRSWKVMRPALATPVDAD